MEKVNKTDKEWDIINFKNSLGPQIGGLMHDAVAIVSAEIGCGKVMESGDELHDARDRIEHWVSVLYEIAEAKKLDIIASKPTDEEVKAF